MSEAYRTVTVTRIVGQGLARTTDAAATEEPMEIRLNGESFAVVMRTPGNDRELVAGFLLAERIVRGPDDLGTIQHCHDAEHPDLHNVVNATLSDEIATAVGDRRKIVMTSSCGLCGRVTLDSLRAEAPRIEATWTLDGDMVAGLPGRLRQRQRAFDATGGLHAAGLFDRDGRLDCLAEDVGRHNAVDKVIGRSFLHDRFPLDRYALVVSGRASFEIVQKAFLAGIPIVCAVSAPSSLAIELADETGITLLGFVREGGFNIYTHAERIVVGNR